MFLTPPFRLSRLLSASVVAVFLGSAFGAGPVIFQALDPVRPDETLLLFGADVTPRATATGLRLADEPVDAPPAAPVKQPVGSPAEMEMLQATDLSAKVVIPKPWAPGIYAVRLKNAGGASNWQFANRPALWWQMSGPGGRVNPGGELRVFGKNFGPKSRLWLVNARGESTELPVTETAENDATASVPATVPSGAYRLWLHRGFGGAAGFGEPLEVEVAPAEKWSEARFNVRDFGAKGDNRNDDTPAIRRALVWAGEHGGGTVYLPRGTYLVTGKLVIPRRTALRGESRESTWIKVPHVWPAAPKLLPEFDAVFAGNGDFAVEDLSIVAQDVQRIVAAPDVPAMVGKGMARVPASVPAADGVRLRNLRIRHLYFANRITEIDPAKLTVEGPTTIAVKGADFLLEDSEVVSAGMPIQIVDATRAKISGNVLRTGRGWYGLWNFRDGLFEKNDISAGDLSGSFGGVQGAAAHVMFAKNRWHHAFGGEREALTFDTPYFAVWMGSVEAEGATLRLGKKAGGVGDLATTPPANLLAVVAGGRGVGQAVPVTRVSADSVELSRPFAVAPDEKSTVVLGTKKSRVLIVDNAIEDASVAVQLYAQSNEFVVARNHAVRTGGSYAHAYDVFGGARERRYSYALFNQWIDNVFAEGLVFDQGPWPGAYVGYTVQRSQGLTRTIPAVGNRLVGNRLLEGTKLGATNIPHVGPENLIPGAIPMARDAIFEGNSIAHQSVGISVDPGHWFTLLRANQTDDVILAIENRGNRTLIK